MKKRRLIIIGDHTIIGRGPVEVEPGTVKRRLGFHLTPDPESKRHLEAIDGHPKVAEDTRYRDRRAALHRYLAGRPLRRDPEFSPTWRRFRGWIWGRLGPGARTDSA
jgi:hypothetical protein